MHNRFKICKFLFIACALMFAHPLWAVADHWQMNMYKGVTPVSQDIYDLHMIAIYVCAGIGVAVFGVMIYALIHHRKSRGYQAASFHDNSRLEIIWTIIPFLILIGLAIPATKTLIRMDDTSDSDITIKIVGYQWRWQYQYLDQGISYFSNLSTPYTQIENQAKKGEWYLLEVDKPLVVPVNQKIRFLVTSNDVIHSWWVPELGIKRDAIPGFMYEAWATIEKPGVYRGQCAELCGINHGFMPIVVQAVSDEDFKAWVAAQPKVVDPYLQSQGNTSLKPAMTQQALMTEGKKVYEQFCAACHKSDGTGMPPVYLPLKGSSVVVGKPIERNIDVVLNGRPGTAMQAFRDQLTDEQLASVITYIRNSWTNNTGDIIQPEEVAQVRHQGVQQPKMVDKAKAGGLQ